LSSIYLAWDTSKVINMSFMFSGASKFNKPLNEWNTGNVTDMRGIFILAINFNQPISNWDTKKVTNMNFMFNNARKFNQDISSWVTDSVLYMKRMFYEATNFDQSLTTARYKSIGVSGTNIITHAWNVSNVLIMEKMFFGASNFKRSIAGWDVTSVENLKDSEIFGRKVGYPQTPKDIYNYFYNNILWVRLKDEPYVNKCSYKFLSSEPVKDLQLEDIRERLFTFDSPEKKKNTG